jgi:hypothetical protein
VLIIIVALIPFVVAMDFADYQFYQWSTMGWYMYLNLAALLLTLCSILIWFQTESAGPKRKTLLKLISTIILFAAFIMVILRFKGEGLFGTTSILMSSYLGLVYIAASAMVFLFFLRKLKLNEQNFGLKFLLPLTLICSIDLLGSYRNYSYSNADQPFVNSIQSLYRNPNVELVYPNFKNESHNLFEDPQFETLGDKVSPWIFGGNAISLCAPHTKKDQSTGAVAAVCNVDESEGNLFQDVQLKYRDTAATFGAWVRSSSASPIKLVITSPTANRGGLHTLAPSDGRWHWVTSSVSTNGPGHVVRPHVSVQSGQRVEIFNPLLVTDGAPMSTIYPRHGEIVKNKVAPYEPNQYRLNFIHRLSDKNAPELLTNFASIFKLRTYAGVDSDMSADWIKFLTALEDLSPDWYHRAGLLSNRTNDRTLDLLGVKYSRDNSGEPLYREGAVPRIAAFSDYETVPDLDHALIRITEKSFSPLLSVVIENGFTSSFDTENISEANFDKVRPLEYNEHGTSQIHISVPNNVGRVIFFGDRYNSNWKAYWNETEIPVHRSNGAFMAVKIPSGPGSLVFKFEPRLFVLGAHLSKLGLLVLFLTTIGLFLYERRIGRAWC